MAPWHFDSRFPCNFPSSHATNGNFSADAAESAAANIKGQKIEGLHGSPRCGDKPTSRLFYCGSPCLLVRGRQANRMNVVTANMQVSEEKLESTASVASVLTSVVLSSCIIPCLVFNVAQLFLHPSGRHISPGHGSLD